MVNCFKGAGEGMQQCNENILSLLWIGSLHSTNPKRMWIDEWIAFRATKENVERKNKNLLFKPVYFLKPKAKKYFFFSVYSKAHTVKLLGEIFVHIRSSQVKEREREEALNEVEYDLIVPILKVVQRQTRNDEHGI